MASRSPLIRTSARSSGNCAISALTTLAFSRWAGVIFSLLHCGTVIVSWSVAVPAWVSAAITLALLLNLWAILRAHVFRNSARAINALSISSGRLFVHLHSGSVLAVEGIRSAVLNPVVIAMTLGLEGTSGSVRLLVPFDAVPADEFRQLRLKLGKLLEPAGMVSG